MYLNKAIVIGNLTRDPEFKSLPSGVPVCSFSMATNRVWKDSKGARQESADFHNVVVFGKQANSVATFLRKGSQALVEGRLQTRSWDDTRTKSKVYRTEIVADRVQFGSRPSSAAAAPAHRGEGVDEPAKDDLPEIQTIDYPEESINLDDIPF